MMMKCWCYNTTYTNMKQICGEQREPKKENTWFEQISRKWSFCDELEEAVKSKK